MSDKPMCAECGEVAGAIHLVEIAWPGSEPFFLDQGPIELGHKFVSNPKANGKTVSLWLHAECEAAAVARLEQQGR
jgi:hypothetical protein